MFYHWKLIRLIFSGGYIETFYIEIACIKNSMCHFDWTVLHNLWMCNLLFEVGGNRMLHE